MYFAYLSPGMGLWALEVRGVREFYRTSCLLTASRPALPASTVIVLCTYFYTSSTSLCCRDTLLPPKRSQVEISLSSCISSCRAQPTSDTLCSTLQQSHYLYDMIKIALLCYSYCCYASSVDIATLYGLDGPGIESRSRRDFPRPSRPALGFHQASCTV